MIRSRDRDRDRRAGTVLVTALWMVALMMVVITSFTVGFYLRSEFSGAVDRLRTARELALSGGRLWIQQLRAETLSRPRGVVLTEIMPYNPRHPDRRITINEVDPAASCGTTEFVEVFNRSHVDSIDLSGWVLDENRGRFGSFVRGTRISPREHRVVTGRGLNNDGDVVRLRDPEGRVVDRFAYRQSPPANQSWQVLPDGRNGMKPAPERSPVDPAWTSQACTRGESNGVGLWLRLGTRRYEGVELRQHNRKGEVVNRFNFATDTADSITKRSDYLDLSDGGALLVVAPRPGTLDEELNREDPPDVNVRVRGSKGTFPAFRGNQLRISVHQPRRLQAPGSPPRRFVFRDGIPPENLRTIRTFEGHRGIDWLVRTDVSATGPSTSRHFLRGDSTSEGLRAGDPGRFRPRLYEQYGHREFKLDDPGSIPPRKRGRLLVSELARIRPKQHDHLVITRLSSDHSPEFVEVFNPSLRPLTLAGWREEIGARRSEVDEAIPPGEYRILCGGDANLLRVSGRNYRCDLNMDSSLANSGEGFWVHTGESNVRDRVGDPAAGEEFREGPGVEVSGSFHLLRRSTAGGYPVDTNHNQHDLRERVSAGDLGRLRAGFTNESTRQFVELYVSGSGRTYQPDPGEYVELYNSNRREAVDPTSGYAIRDHRDAYFEPTNRSHRLMLHTADPNRAHGRLGPGQVGLVMPPGADTVGLGVSGRIDSGVIRAYTAGGSRGSVGFLNGGLHNDTGEAITLRGNPEGPRRVDLGEDGSAPEVRPRIAWTKGSLGGGDRASNWVRTGPGGNPGRVGETDHFSRLWGWGGEWVSGVDLDRKLYLPSLSNAFSEGDVGYVRMRSIEDETGKINLLKSRRDVPKHRFELTLEQPPLHRAVPEPRARAIIRHNRQQDPGTWLTPGDFLTPGPEGEGLLAGSLRTLRRRRRVYSPHRIETDRHRININTAPYEALRTLPIKAPYREEHSPNFLTHRMALAILKRRRGSTPVRDEEGFYRIGFGHAYGKGARPFVSPAEVCELPEMQVEGFDCGVLSRHVRTRSEGRFRIVVQGVVLDDRGETAATRRAEWVVDRRPLVNREGPIRILYRRLP